MGAGEVERDVCELAFSDRGGDCLSIINGELSAVESAESKVYPSSLLPSYGPDRKVPSLSCGELLTDPKKAILV